MLYSGAWLFHKNPWAEIWGSPVSPATPLCTCLIINQKSFFLTWPGADLLTEKIFDIFFNSGRGGLNLSPDLFFNLARLGLT